MAPLARSMASSTPVSTLPPAAVRHLVAARSRTPPPVDRNRPRRLRKVSSEGQLLACQTIRAGVAPEAVAPAAAVQSGEQASVPAFAKTLVERAADAVKPTGLPGRLPCREEEQNRIHAHMRAAIKQGGSEQVLYMSGMPGTGKTAALVECVRQLQQMPQVPKFTFVHVNAMRLGTPGAVFGEILSHMSCASRSAAAAAHGELHRFFASRRHCDPVVVLLIDEIDHLVTKNQAVLYSVFELLSLPKARLVIAAISNTMDLPERMLPRVASRFEIIRVDFWPYSRDQIQNILLERLRRHDAVEAFTADALKRCAARVAAGSGDVRKSLQLCLRALQIAQSGEIAAHERPVRQPSMSAAGTVAAAEAVQGCHLDAAAKDLLYANPATSAIRGLSCKTRRFLVALLLELRHGKSDVVPFRKAATRYEKLTAICCQGANAAAQDSSDPLWAPPSSGSHVEDAEGLAHRLEAMRLICVQGKESTPAKSGEAKGGPVLALIGGLDTEDLATALLSVEEDPGVRELLRDS